MNCKNCPLKDCSDHEKYYFIVSRHQQLNILKLKTSKIDFFNDSGLGYYYFTRDEETEINLAFNSYLHERVSEKIKQFEYDIKQMEECLITTKSPVT
jgi:hypothetical protein